MKKLIILTTILAVAGCSQNVQEAKMDAHKRWYHTRAEVLAAAAHQHLQVGQLDLAQSKAMESLSLEEGNVPARTILAKVYIEQGNYIPAIRELEKLRQKPPESSQVVYLLAVAQEKEGRLDEALTNYRRAYALDNTSLAPVLAAGEVLVEKGQVQEAQKYLESYTAISRNEPGLFELLGRLALMRQEYDKAAKCFQQASDLDYKNLRYKEALGRSQFLAGRFGPARETFTDLKGMKGYTPTATVHTMLGDCCLALDRPLDARESYQLACDMNPSSATSWVNLAKVDLALEDIPRAILAARQALQLEPGDLDAAMVLGFALLREGQTSRALGVLKPAGAAHPDSSMAQCLLGMAYAAGGDAAQAQHCYSLAVKLEPANAMARNLMDGGAIKRLSRAD